MSSGPKIAVQYFGHLRTWQRCHELTNKNLLSKFDCDVFIHTWNTRDHTDATWYSHSSSEIGDFESEIENLEATLQPKAMMIEAQNFINEERTLGSFAARGIRYSLHSMSQVNRMRTDFERNTGKVYDFVLMIRPDVEVLEILNFDNYTKIFNQNPLCFVHFVSHMGVLKSSRISFPAPLAADVFFMGKPEGMNRIADIHTSFEASYVAIFNLLEDGDKFCPEVGFLESLRAKGIVSRYYSLSYAIRRGNPKLDIIVFPSGSIVTSKKRKFLVSVASQFPAITKKALSILQKLVSILVDSR